MGRGEADLAMEQWINVVLTGVIVIAVSAQAWFTRRQAQILERSEKRVQDRDRPAVQITGLTHGVSRADPSGEPTTMVFEGFTVTNAGLVHVIITEFVFELGRVLDNHDTEPPTTHISFSPVASYGDSALSTMSLPHRLQHGESFKVLFDKTKLVEEAAKIGGETPVHMRPCCRDSLGNRYTVEYWTIYREAVTVIVGDPSPGRISEEDWQQLPPEERRRGYRSSHKWVH